MAQLKEADFFYGAVLSTLLNNKITPMIIEGGNDRQVYDFTTDSKNFRLFVKYRSNPTETKAADYYSWQFVFTPKDIAELTAYLKMDKEISLGLVCGNPLSGESKYAVLHSEDIRRLFAKSKLSLTISIKKGEHAFRVSIGGGRDNAIKVKSNRLY